MPRNGSRLSVLTRRWLAAVCAVSAASGIVIAWRINEQAQPCWTVRQLISFNRDGQAALKAKAVGQVDREFVDEMRALNKACPG